MRSNGAIFQVIFILPHHAMVFLSHPSTVETIVSFFFHADIAIHMTNLEYEISSIDSAYFVKQTA